MPKKICGELPKATILTCVNVFPFPTALIGSNYEVIAANEEWNNSDTSGWLATEQRLIDDCLRDGELEVFDPQQRNIGRLKCVAIEGREDVCIIATIVDSRILQSGSDIWNVDEIHQRKLKDLSEMAAGVAHEIYNPLSVIMAKIHHLRSRTANGEIDIETLSTTLDKIEYHSTRIYKIAKGMRTFSRDARTDGMVESQLSSILEGAFDVLNARIRDSGVRIEIVGMKETFMLPCQSTQLMQVFTNLAQNSLDAIQSVPFPNIKVEIQEFETQFEIAFSDNGPGISMENEAKIFAPFFTTKPPGVGTGIGLSISLRIINDHKGSLVLDRKRGPSCFVIRLPKVAHATKIGTKEAI